MKACHIGKTILVWNKLNDKEIIRLVNSIKDIIKIYRDNYITQNDNRLVPISLIEEGNYLCIMKKNNEIMCTVSEEFDDLKNIHFNYKHIINADILHKSIELLENAHDDIKTHIKILNKFPETEWIKLKFAQDYETYLLSPNMNPEDFIKSLQNDSLPNMYKQFLQEAGFSLEIKDYSKDVADVINEINEELFER